MITWLTSLDSAKAYHPLGNEGGRRPFCRIWRNLWIWAAFFRAEPWTWLNPTWSAKSRMRFKGRRHTRTHADTKIMKKSPSWRIHESCRHSMMTILSFLFLNSVSTTQQRVARTWPIHNVVRLPRRVRYTTARSRSIFPDDTWDSYEWRANQTDNLFSKNLLKKTWHTK